MILARQVHATYNTKYVTILRASFSIPVFRRLWLAVLGHVEAAAEVVLAELAAVDLLREVDHGARRPAPRLVAQDDGKESHVHLLLVVAREQEEDVGTYLSLHDCGVAGQLFKYLDDQV